MYRSSGFIGDKLLYEGIVNEMTLTSSHQDNFFEIIHRCYDYMHFDESSAMPMMERRDDSWSNSTLPKFISRRFGILRM